MQQPDARRPFLQAGATGVAIDRPVVGMIHLKPLPGSPRGARSSIDAVVDAALEDLASLVAGGVDAVMIENYGDIPFHPGTVDPHTVAAMTRVALEVRRTCRLPIGINVLRNDPVAAMSIAHAVDAAMIRVNVHSGAMVTDQGVIQGQARQTLDLRAKLGAEVRILADVDVKHARPLVEVPIEESAADCAERGLADALVVTGPRTGAGTSIDQLRRARNAVAVPVLAGSGVTLATIDELLQTADGLIVGSWLKHDGDISRPVDRFRVEQLIERVIYCRCITMT